MNLLTPTRELLVLPSSHPYVKGKGQTPVWGAVSFAAFVSQADASWVLQCLAGSAKAFNRTIKAKR